MHAQRKEEGYCPQPNGRCDLPSPAPSESGEEAKDGFIGSPGSERGRCVTNRFSLSLSLPFSLLGTTINLFLLADAAQTNGRLGSSSSDFPNQQLQSHVEAPCACVTSQHASIDGPNSKYHNDTVSDTYGDKQGRQVCKFRSGLDLEHLSVISEDCANKDKKINT